MSGLTRRSISPELADYRTWPTPDLSMCSADDVAYYYRMHAAICLYLDGACLGHHLRSLSLVHGQVLRQLRRCLTLAPDGRIFGFRAVRKYLHVEEYRRTAPLPTAWGTSLGSAGLMQQCFRWHHALQQDFDRYLLHQGQRRTPGESRLQHVDAHSHFIHLCRQHGLRETEWPLAMPAKGYKAICNYIRAFYRERYDRIVYRRHGRNAYSRSRTGRGFRSRLHAPQIFDVWEMDEHRADFIGSIGIETPKGLRWVPIGRVGLVFVVERYSQCVLAVLVYFAREVSSDEVLQALEAATHADAPCPEAQQTEGVDFATGPRYGCVLLVIDNFESHLTDEVRLRAAEVLGCAVNYAALGHWERRALGEAIFGLIEERGFHRLRQTTGSGPGDPRRSQAEKHACKARMSVADIRTMVNTEVAKYNRTPTSGDYGISPAQQLRDDVRELAAVLPLLPPLLPGQPALDVGIARAFVRGDQADGRRPRFNFAYADYTNRVLATAWHLVNHWVVIHYRRANVRTVEAFTEDGQPLGVMTALGHAGEWDQSYETRRELAAATLRGKIDFRIASEPPLAQLASQNVKAIEAANRRGPRVTRAAMAVAREQSRGNPALPSDFPTPPQDEFALQQHDADRHAEESICAINRHRPDHRDP